MPDPHAAIFPAFTFITEYYTQLDRLLSDVTRALLEASPSWQRLRRMGNSYETEAEVKIGSPERFLPHQIGNWYAPSNAFSGRSYGAEPAMVTRLAFAGVWLGSERDPPELFIGWLEGMSLDPDQVVETSLKKCNGWLDPHETNPVQGLTSLKEASFQAHPFRGDEQKKMAMVRLPLAVLTGPDVLSRLLGRWLAALAKGSQVGTPPSG